MHGKQNCMHRYNCGWSKSKHLDFFFNFLKHLSWLFSMKPKLDFRLPKNFNINEWILSNVPQLDIASCKHQVKSELNAVASCLLSCSRLLSWEFWFICNLWWWHESWTRTSSCWFLTCVHLLYSSAHSQAFSQFPSGLNATVLSESILAS